MQDKMKKLLEQINMKSDYLENASIDKIVVYDKSNLWEFYINNDNILPVYIYDELCNKLKSTFTKIDDIIININNNSNSIEFLDDYFDKLIIILGNESIKYNTFIGRKLINVDNKYIFEVFNKAEYTYMIEKKEYINKWMNRYGFKINIDIVLTKNKEDEILSEIEKDMVVETPSIKMKENVVENKPEEKKYYKAKKDTSVTPIKDILYEVDNVTIEGMIFGIDMFEAKSGYKIITLKVTDNSDSIYVKLFTKDEDEYARIKDLLKEGKMQSREW